MKETAPTNLRVQILFLQNWGTAGISQSREHYTTSLEFVTWSEALSFSDYLLYVLVSDLNCTLKLNFYWVLMNYLFILKCSHLQSNFFSFSFYIWNLLIVTGSCLGIGILSTIVLWSIIKFSADMHLVYAADSDNPILQN